MKVSLYISLYSLAYQAKLTTLTVIMWFANKVPNAFIEFSYAGFVLDELETADWVVLASLVSILC